MAAAAGERRCTACSLRSGLRAAGGPLLLHVDRFKGRGAPPTTPRAMAKTAAGRGGATLRT
eukprot:9977038-Lingulodinium_polyedra.AAC.1